MSWSLTLLYVYILILQVWGIEDTYCRYHNLSAYPSPHIYQQINTDEYNENCLRYPSFNATLQHGVLNVEHCSSAEYRPQGSPAWMPYTAPVAITRGQTVRVRCSDGTSVMLVNPPEAKKETGFSSSNPSVFVVMVDAVSYEALHRLMPNTVDYLKGDETLDVFEFTKFSTVGLNSNPNKFATFGRHEYSKDMDKEIKLSWLWEYAKKLGYTTVIAEDQCPRHDAVWDLMNVPTQHNSVKPEEGPDYVFLDQMCVDDPHPNPYCVQGQWGYEYVADYVTGLLSTLEEQNSKQPVFMWSNFVDAHEPGQWAAALMDETVVNYLNAIVNSRFMDNGVIVFLSDHGLHFGDFAYSSVVGSAENKHPFLYTISKKGFLNQDILTSNQDKLVTPYDIYQTLSSVIGYNGVVNKRDYNILSERVPSYRTCEMAGIPAPFCSCSYGPATCEPQLPYQIWETCLSRYAHPRFFDWVHYSQNELKPRYNKEFNECDSTAHWCAFGLSLGWNGTSTSGLREYVANTPELQSNEYCWTWPTDCNWGQVMNHYFNEGFIGDKNLQR